MFEIEIVHKDLFEDYLAKEIAYKNGIYDFTFENRYLVYHIDRKTIVSYIAIDMTTDRSSRIVSKKHSEMYSNETYHTMIPDILYSVKHTGDRRYLCSMAYYNIEPIEMINTIFRVVLPNYGYAVREAQINLCIDMFKGLTKKQVAICEAEVGTGKTLAYRNLTIKGFKCLMKSNLIYSSMQSKKNHYGTTSSIRKLRQDCVKAKYVG